MPEYQENSSVISIERPGPGLCRLTLRAPLIAAAAAPGQFVMAACGPFLDPLLRRPFSIHRLPAPDTLQLLFRIVGRGTEALAGLRPADPLSLLGPLGRGFPLRTEGPACLVGGGIGIAPLLFLAENLLPRLSGSGSLLVLLGGRTAAEIEPLAGAFRDLGCPVEAATDDGSLGHHGLVTDLLPRHLPSVRQVFACGPTAMMAAAAALCRQSGVACAVSLEARMACGLGACLGCTVRGRDRYLHVCKEGPVFPAEEVLWTA